jgi:hypothetical protein
MSLYVPVERADEAKELLGVAGEDHKDVQGDKRGQTLEG